MTRASRRFTRLRLPVISVGNISVGGSGKTPFVQTLGRWLNLQGIAFDILSRGYGRISQGVLQWRARVGAGTRRPSGRRSWRARLTVWR